MKKIAHFLLMDSAWRKKTLLIMKISFVLLLLGLQVSAHSFSQDKITLHFKKGSLIQVFKAIERQSIYRFFYSDDVVMADKPIAIMVKDAEINDVMAKIIQGSTLNWKQVDKNIIVFSDENDNQSKKAIISGLVKSQSGEILSGVTITEKGTNNITTSDNKGQFRLSVTGEQGVLVFTYIGYTSFEEKFSAGTGVLEITLTAFARSLEDVVVIGYGTSKKKDLTGSVASIKGADIKATPVVALDRAMQGRVAGVQVTTNSARPGGESTIRIRGTGSVNAGNEPLYVIDGYPTGNLNSINPGDIASIEILKDASATAIYGSRGSNGVVLVTTQRGTAGQSNINFDSYVGNQSLLRKIPLLNAREYAEFINEARVNGGGVPYFDGSTADKPLPSSLGTGTDWQDEVFRRAPMQNYQLSFSGGEQKTRYAISGGYFDQQGIIQNSYFKRFTVRANLDREVSARLKIGLSMQGAYTRSNSARTETEGGASSGVTTAAINYAPTFKMYNPGGTYYREQGPLNGNLVDNPIGLAKEITDQFLTTRLLSNVFADFTITKGLTFRTSWGADLYNTKSNFYVTRLIGLGAGSGGRASIGSSTNVNWLNENTLTYSRTFSEKHSLNALLGYTTQAYDNESVTANAASFNDDFASFNNLGAGASLQAPASASSSWSLISYLARINYGYDSRYLFTLTARRDGSSRFGPNNKYGFFPSGAFAWRISNEKFMHPVKSLSDLKLRISYGVAGNQEIGDYRFYSTIQNPSYALGGVSNSIGGVPSGIGNEDLKWEKNQQFDIGIDAGFFDNRLQLTADYYIKTTTDLLFSVNVPQTTGYSTALRNIGKVENKGWELSLNSENIRNKNFSWSSSFNIAFNTNKVLTLDGRPSFTAGDGIGHLQVSNTVLLAVGQALGNFYGRVVNGIFQNQGEIDKSAQKTAKPGDIWYKDLNNDGVINDNDRQVIGNGYPKFFGGFNNTFNYKGFELNVFIQGSYGNDILNYLRFDLYNLNGNNNQSKDVLNRWTINNPSTTIPRANSAGGQRILSTFHIEDGSYLRVKMISFGYNFSGELLRKIALKKARLYVSAQNLFTITNYKGYDPEVSRFGTTSVSQGMDYGGYPSSKTIMAGVNLNF
ncbi:MAG: TonB-dependent receptor [Chitinophagaceae bacterium]